MLKTKQEVETLQPLVVHILHVGVLFYYKVTYPRFVACLNSGLPLPSSNLSFEVIFTCSWISTERNNPIPFWEVSNTVSKRRFFIQHHVTLKVCGHEVSIDTYEQVNKVYIFRLPLPSSDLSFEVIFTCSQISTERNNPIPFWEVSNTVSKRRFFIQHHVTLKECGHEVSVGE